MDQFPKMLYRAPGPEAIHGGFFSTLVVDSADEQRDALADGWHESTADATNAHTSASADDTSPPTRTELEQKATELGIDFSPNIGDRKLSERIAAKLAGQ